MRIRASVIESAASLWKYLRISGVSRATERDRSAKFLSFARIFFCVAFLCVIGARPAEAQITWKKVWATPPGPAPRPYYNGYHDIHYDPYTNKTWIYSTDTAGGAESIYSSLLHYFDTTTGTDTTIGSASQPAGGGCLGSSPTWPYVHHPVGQVWVDLIRHRLWIMEGVGCVYIYPEQWYYQLDNPIGGHASWAKVVPAHLPTKVCTGGPNGLGPAATCGLFNNASVVHDTDHDAFILFGYDSGSNSHSMQVYCDTSVNPSPGTLTAPQRSIGCANSDDWTDITSQVKGGSLDAGGSGGFIPPGFYYPNLEYDTVHHNVIQWAGLKGCCTPQNQTWTYEPVAKIWTNRNPANPPVNSSNNNENGRVAHAFNPVDGKYYYHVTAHTPSAGNPPVFPPQDWVYDSGVNTWTELSIGQGPPLTETMTYDYSSNSLIAWAAKVEANGLYQASGVAEIWVGTFGSPTPPVIASGLQLVAGTVGATYLQRLSASGATPMTWRLTSGALPPGLVMDTTGLLSGTPSVAGAYGFSAQVSNSAGTAGPQSFSLTIGAAIGGGGSGAAGGAAGGGGTVGGGGSGGNTATFPITLTVQEALYPGSVPGVARTNEPFCQGVPLADSMGITSTTSLGLSGAAAGQFRMLGVWPSGNYKWIEVCGIVPTLGAGGTAIVSLTNSGSGNFGGTNLASDNGSTITVTTGAATFTVKKANFNVVDQVMIGNTTAVAPGASQGLALIGPNPLAPYPANVTCGTGAGQSSCTTVYLSANDPNSTCAIEKNGPVEAALKCTGDHVDGAGHIYMHFTVREYFYQGKTNVKITSTLRNADYGTSGTFATAYKGYQGYELRISPNISTAANFAFANHTAMPTTGNLNGSDNAYLYQGQSQSLAWQDGCNPGAGCVAFTNDTGYSIVKNGATLLAGTGTQYPQGWASLSDSNGVGVDIGVYQLSAYFPKSLEFNGGGHDVRIGIWARENSQPSYQAWPQHSTFDLYLNFHANTPTASANDFLKFQHYLLARAPYTHYNATGVFPYTLLSPTVEDGFYQQVQQTATVPPAGPAASSVITAASGAAPMVLTLGNGAMVSSLAVGQTLIISGGAGTGCSGMNAGYTVTAISGNNVTLDFNGAGCTYTSSSATANALPVIGSSRACCIQDFGTADLAHWALPVYRFYGWHTGGGDNQSEFRWSYLLNFLSRGMTGRYLRALHFYRYLGDSAWARSDGFNWRDKPNIQASGPELDTFGRPSAASANNSLATGHANWLDQEHGHWYGMPDSYFITGDETIRDAIMDGPADYFLNAMTTQAGLFGGMSGRVNTSGTLVTLALGPNFDNSMLLGPISIATNQYKVKSISDATHLVLTSSAGTQTFVPWTSWGGLANARSVGVNLMGAARLSKFLSAIGDPTDAAAVLDLGAKDYMMQVDADICVSGYPVVNGAPCVSGPTSPEGNWKTEGISRTRGLVMDGANTTFLNPWCLDQNRHVRYAAPFFIHNLIQGVLELRDAEGPNWPEYMNSLDLTYGMSRWSLSEMYVDDGSGRWDVNGFRYYEAIDLPASCADTTHVQDYHTVPQAQQTVSFNFLPKYLVDGDVSWAQKFKMNLQRDMSALGTGTSDFGSVQPAQIISILGNPTMPKLNVVPITSAVDSGGGSYIVSWTVPAGAISYRIKWGPKRIVDWIGFDPMNNVFTGDPVNTMPWFAATNVTPLPSPSAAGSTQSITINTGNAGLTAANFSVKAYSGGQSTAGPDAGVFSLSASSLSFGNQVTGIAAQQPITLSNQLSSAVSISGIAITGSNRADFTQTNTCGSSLASGASCIIRITFQPSSALLESAIVNISDNATGSPQTVTLLGTGTSSSAGSGTGAGSGSGSGTGTGSGSGSGSGTGAGSGSGSGTGTGSGSGSGSGTGTGSGSGSGTGAGSGSGSGSGTGAGSGSGSGSGTGTGSGSGSGTETGSGAGSGSGKGRGSGATGAGGAGTGSAATKPAVGSSAAASIDGNTKFQIAVEDLSAAVSSCRGCQFQSALDLIGGQTTEVQLSTTSTTPIAAVLTLKQGALNGTVTSIGNNQFILQSTEGSPWPVNVLVLTNSLTEFTGVSTLSSTVKAGQAVSARGLLFRSGPTGIPTLVARRIRTQ
jgi:hypothetical protein